MPVLERVTPEDALERVQNALGELVTETKLNFGHVDVWCAPENLVEIATRLRDGA